MKNVLIAALLVLAGFANAATVPTPTTQPWGTSLVEKDSRGLGIGKMKIVDANGTTVSAGNISSVTDASGATVPATANFSTTQTLSGSVTGATIALNGGATLSVFVQNLTSGTIFPYVSNDGLAWIASYYEIRSYGGSGARLSAISTGGAYTVNVSGWKYFRLGSVGISGTATATINVSAAANTATLENVADNTYPKYLKAPASYTSYSLVSATATTVNLTFAAGTSTDPYVVYLSAVSGTASAALVQILDTSTPPANVVAATQIGSYIDTATNELAFGPYLGNFFLHAAGLRGTAVLKLKIETVK